MDNLEKLKAKVAKEPTSRLVLPLSEEYRKAGMLDEAVNVLKTAVDAQPNYHSARVALGKAYMDKGMLDEAISEFVTVISSVPDNLIAHKKLAEIYAKKGNIETARREYMTILKLSPIDEESRQKLEELSGDTKEPEEEGGMMLEATRYGDEISGDATDAEGVTVAAEPEVIEEVVEIEEEAEAGVFELPADEGMEELEEAVEEIEEDAEAGVFELPADEGMEELEEAVEEIEEEAEAGVFELPADEGMEELEEAVEEIEEEAEAGVFELPADVVSDELEELEDETEEPAPEFDIPSGPSGMPDETTQGPVDSAPDFTLADDYLKNEEYAKVLKIYRQILKEHPDNREALQRNEELKTLLKLLGKEKEALVGTYSELLDGIKRRRDEFFGRS